MSENNVVAHESFPDTHHDTYSKTVFGFWVYLITDFMLFATLFAAYAVLKKGTFGGPSSADLFNINYVLMETLVLSSAVFVIGLAGVFAHRRAKIATIITFLITFVLGSVFFAMQTLEFASYVKLGHSWKNSGFLSAFFTLTGTFWVHVLLGLMWILVFLIPVFKNGVTAVSIKRLTCLKMFWQFLGVVWGFIFSIVYLLGVVK